MSRYDNYVGRPYEEGRVDCYALIRDYIHDQFGVTLPNYARPANFFEDPQLDLLSLYKDAGFRLLRTDDIQEGDVLLFSIRSTLDNHCGVVSEDNQFLHHLYNQPSRVDPLHPKWSFRATRVVRHPEVAAQVEGTVETAHLHEILDADLFKNPRFQKLLERAKAMEAEQRALRGDPADGGGPGEA